MRSLMSSLLFFSFLGVLISSCSVNAPVSTQRVSTTLPETKVLSVIPTSTPKPSFTPTNSPTNTIPPNNKLGLIVTFGEKVKGPSYPGIPVFSPDGQIIALANPRIRFWDVNTHQLIREIEYPFGEGCHFFDAKFSPNGKYFAVSIAKCRDDKDSAGHLLIWDVLTGNLLQEWTQTHAKMPGATGKVKDNYIIPVYAFAFLPDSTGIVFANGNTLETRNVLDNEKQDVLNLGLNMYATQISLSPDGKLAYVLMGWFKYHSSSPSLMSQYKFQSWNLATQTMIRASNYPETSSTLHLELLGTRLVQVDFTKDSSQIFNLETNEVRDLPFRAGWRYYNSDGSLMIYAHLFDAKPSIELWKTDMKRNIYSFMPDLGGAWIYSMNHIVFSPDNKILAIDHQEQISLWNISPVIEP